jgi:predicted NBD/HSP70 family sugar kinase
MGIAILVQILNPELIILGGRIAEAKEYLTIPIEQALFKYTIPNIREDMNIVVSKLGDKANLLGSVINVMENVFDS